MAKIYKVWIDVELIDEENDIYENQFLNFGEAATFDNLEDAEKFANDLQDKCT